MIGGIQARLAALGAAIVAVVLILAGAKRSGRNEAIQDMNQRDIENANDIRDSVSDVDRVRDTDIFYRD